MELILNVAWLLLAVFMVWAWLRYAPEKGADRRVQLVALGLVILILLPAISMTDDLMAARNPAEVDTYLRRDHELVVPHVLLPGTVALIVSLFAGLSLGTVKLASVRRLPLPLLYEPLLSSIDSRPPPFA